MVYLPFCNVRVLITEVNFRHVCMYVCPSVCMYISAVPIGQISMKSDADDFCANLSRNSKFGLKSDKKTGHFT
jgi:hypothetical protein